MFGKDELLKYNICVRNTSNIIGNLSLFIISLLSLPSCFQEHFGKSVRNLLKSLLWKISFPSYSYLYIHTYYAYAYMMLIICFQVFPFIFILHSVFYLVDTKMTFKFPSIFTDIIPPFPLKMNREK